MDEIKYKEADTLFVTLITQACQAVEKLYGDDICARLMDEYLIAEDCEDCPLCSIGEQIAAKATEEKAKIAKDLEEFLKHMSALVNAANELPRK